MVHQAPNPASQAPKNTAQSPRSTAIDPKIMSWTLEHQANLKKINQALSEVYSSSSEHEESAQEEEEEEEEEAEEEEYEEEEEDEEDEEYEEQEDEEDEDAEEENEEPAQVTNHDQDGQYFFELPGPPAAVYYSEEDLLNSVKSFAMEHGYVIVVRRSEKDKKKIFKCDRSVVAFPILFSHFN